MTLKTDYKDDVLDTSKNTNRRFNVVNNPDGTISLVEVTDFTQEGDVFGAKDMNETNTEVNALSENLTKLDIIEDVTFSPATNLVNLVASNLKRQGKHIFGDIHVTLKISEWGGIFGSLNFHPSINSCPSASNFSSRAMGRSVALAYVSTGGELVVQAFDKFTEGDTIFIHFDFFAD